MKDGINVEPIPNIKAPPTDRKPGRPRAIPMELGHVVIELYRLGYGYRAIARILRTDYHLNPDFSTVRRILSRLQICPHQGSSAKLSTE